MKNIFKNDRFMKGVCVLFVLFTIAGLFFALDVILPREHEAQDTVAGKTDSYIDDFQEERNLKPEVTDEKPEDFINYERLTFPGEEGARATATTYLIKPGYKKDEFTADKMTDNNEHTSWQAEHDKEGIGEKLTFEFGEGAGKIKCIEIKAGFWAFDKSGDGYTVVYNENLRPTKIKIWMYGFFPWDIHETLEPLELTDEKKSHYIVFENAVYARKVRIEIIETTGNKAGDCSITEVTFWSHKGIWG